MQAFTAKRLITPGDTIDAPLLLVTEGKIVDIARHAERTVPTGVRTLDLANGLIAPGYIDLHIHGSAGFDVMDANGAALSAIESLLARHGITAYYPTTVTAPLDTTLRALERLADAIEIGARGGEDLDCRARPLGIHLEGPFISHL